jgi:hypothetical protein
VWQATTESKRRDGQKRTVAKIDALPTEVARKRRAQSALMADAFSKKRQLCLQQEAP